MFSSKSFENLSVLIISFLLTLSIQNEEGNTVGSFFCKVSDSHVFHIHHWMTSIICIYLLEFLAIDFTHKDKILFAIAGFGLAGFTYSDRLNCYKEYSINNAGIPDIKLCPIKCQPTKN